jgi:hypothetical protein
MRKAAWLVVVVFGVVPNATAQDDFARIRAKLGQRLIVTEGGLTVSGRLTELTRNSLKIGPREIEPGPGLKIERDNGNTIGRGLLVGAGIGAAEGFIVGGEGRRVRALFMTVPGAFLGVLVGASRDRRTTIYNTTADGPAVRAQIAPVQPGVQTTITQSIVANFRGTRLKPGNVVFITEHDVTFRGTVTRVTPRVIDVGARSFSPQRELKIEREGDPLWDGAVIGFAAGALAGATVGQEACLNEPLWHCAVPNGLVFAGIGALIDRGHVGRTTVYDGHPKSADQRAWHLVPTIGSHTKAVALSRRFR